MTKSEYLFLSAGTDSNQNKSTHTLYTAKTEQYLSAISSFTSTYIKQICTMHVRYFRRRKILLDNCRSQSGPETEKGATE
jgi:hypothetical protein